MPPDSHSVKIQSPRPTASGAASGSALPAPHRLNRPDAKPEIIARLEWLDDLMFAAIEGDPVSLDSAADAWSKTIDELGGEALEESRHQYLRRAQSVWNALRHEPNHAPHKVFAAIEIISLLAPKTW